MVIGVSIYAMGIISIIFNIKNSMEEKSRFYPLFKKVTLAISVFQIIFCTLCVWSMGGSVNQIVLFSLPKNRADVLMFQVFYALALILTYPLQLLPAFQLIEKIGWIKAYINPQLKYSRFRRLVLRAIINVSICLIAFTIPQFASFLNILGSVMGTSLNFVIPVYMHYRIFKDKLTTKNKIEYMIILVLGLVGGFCSFVYTIIKLTKWNIMS